MSPKARYPGKLVNQSATATASFRTYGSSLKQLNEIIKELQVQRESLQKISMFDMELPELFPDYYLDPLLEAIGSMPHLEAFDSSIRTGNSSQENRPLVKPETLRRFLQQACNLTEVTLWNWSLENDHIEQGLIPGLQSSTSNVQFLSLRRNPLISSSAWGSLYGLVEHNAVLAYIITDTTFIPSDRQLFFMDLNQRDRHHMLVGGTTIHDKVSILERFSSRESLDLFYYWTRQIFPGLLASRSAADR